MLAKGTFFMHPSRVFFHAVLSKLSSSPTTLDRHVTIYLQREQSFPRHLYANNVIEHTGGSLCLCPLSQEFARTVMTQWSALSHPGLQHLSAKETSPCLPSLRIPPCRSCAVPPALPERSPFRHRRKQFLQTQKAFVQFKHSANPPSDLG